MLPLGLDGAFLRAFRAPRARAAFLMAPGGGCAASRYDWMAGLNGQRVSVFVLDGPSGTTGPFSAGVPHLMTAIDALSRERTPLFAGGHSAGAALILDVLDPAAGRANPRNLLPAGFTPPSGLAGVAVIGCSLQPRPLNMVLPHRFEDRLLARPGDLPLLFLTGTHDLIATPALVEKTRSRYAPPTASVIMAGATHYGWTADPQPTDNPAFDRPDGADLEGQRARGLTYLADWMLGRPLRAVAADTASADVAGRRS